MKKTTWLLPLMGVTTISGFAIPLTGCEQKSQFDWITDEDFELTREQFETDEWYHEQEATEQYFDYAIAHPEIIHEEYAHAFIKYSYKPKKEQLIATEGVTDVQGSFKVRVNNITIKPKFFKGVKHYLVTADFENEMTFNYHHDLEFQYQIYTESKTERYHFETMNFGVTYFSQAWDVSNINVIPVGEKYTWSDTVDVVQTDREVWIDPQTNLVRKDETSVDENHLKKDSRSSIMSDGVGFECAYFEGLKPYLTIDVQSYGQGVDKPIIKNAFDVAQGVDYDTDIILDGLDKGTWTVAGIGMNKQAIKLRPDQYSFEIVDGVGKLHIDALDDDGTPLIKYAPTVYMNYSENP